MSSAIDALSRCVLPWLEPTLAQLEAARRAGSFGHAWLISGPAGVGKVNFALVLAHRLLSDDSEQGSLDAGAALAAMAARHDPMDRLGSIRSKTRRRSASIRCVISSISSR
jgi:hypothetical protein